MDYSVFLQALPLIGSGITALIVFIKRGVTTDIDVSKLHEDMIEMKSDVKKLLLDVAVLKEKTKTIHRYVQEDD